MANQIKQISLTLRRVISEYELSDVYNMDKVGLFYRVYPDATLAAGLVQLKIKNKEQITVTF